MGPNKAWKMNSGSFWTPWCHTAFALRYLWRDCLPYLNHVQLDSAGSVIHKSDWFIATCLIPFSIIAVWCSDLHCRWILACWVFMMRSHTRHHFVSISLLSAWSGFFFCAQWTSSCLYFWKIWNTVLIHVQVWRVNHLWTAEKMVLWTLNSEMSNFVDQFLLHSSLLFWGNSECTLFSTWR